MFNMMSSDNLNAVGNMKSWGQGGDSFNMIPEVSSFSNGQPQNNFGGYGNMATWGQGVGGGDGGGGDSWWGDNGDSILKGGQVIAGLWNAFSNYGMLQNAERGLDHQIAANKADIFNRGTDGNNQLAALNYAREGSLANWDSSSTNKFKTSV